MDNLTRSVGIGSSRFWGTMIKTLVFSFFSHLLFMFYTLHTLSLIINHINFFRVLWSLQVIGWVTCYLGDIF